MDVSLQSVEPTDGQLSYLFEQLLQRVHVISHGAMPSFEEHCTFVRNNPYRAWYIVVIEGRPHGSLYIQNDNSIGLNGLDDLSIEILGQILTLCYAEMAPLPAVPSVRYGKFFFNVAASNDVLMKKLEALGYRPSQVSYVPV